MDKGALQRPPGGTNKRQGAFRSRWQSFLLSLANYGDIVRVQTGGAQHAVPVFQSHCILRASIIRRPAGTEALPLPLSDVATQKSAGSGMRCRLARVVFLVAVFATPLALQPSEPDASRIAQILRDAGRSLEAGNAASFLFYFDRKRFAAYSALESDVDALTRHSEIASSTEVTKVEAEGDAYLVEVDWILRLRPISTFGDVDTRRKLLKLRFERVKDKWKIVKLQPIEFFRAR